MKRIYLDHAAATPLCQEAKAAMKPWLGGAFGNPSSLHKHGRILREAIDKARSQVADALGCLFGEVIFTSSGTESCSMALIGAAASASLVPDRPRRRILVSAADHHCVLHCREILEALGVSLEEVPVDAASRVDLNHLERAMGPDVILVSLIHANNETGALNPIEAASAIARRAGALVHLDAVQTMPWTSLRGLDIDMASLSSHKFHGPPGAGALYLRSGVKIKPILAGGGQEREMRGGTENTPAIVGMGAAAAACLSHPSWKESRRAARDAFVTALIGFQPEGLRWTLPLGEGLEGHAHLSLAGIQADTMLIRLDRAGISASSGAACSSGSLEPSHVLLACGRSPEEAEEGLRFTFGKDTTPEEAVQAAERVAESASEIRQAQSRKGR
jgi:cysteine desulfurase